MGVMAAMFAACVAFAAPVGLPPVPVPADNPITPEKVKLGDKLFHDTRFSSTGKVSCATCHDRKKGFADALPVSEGINGLKGTRNAPTVMNAAYLRTQFWDGREPSLETQSAQPFLNPVEMGLKDHEPILKIVRTDPEYTELFKKAFGKTGNQITMTEVKQALATFQRTLISGNSPFDRYYFGGDKRAMSPAAIRGLDIYIGQGRCVSCHVIEQTQALFTDNRFHMIGVSANQMPRDLDELSAAVEDVKKRGTDIAVLSNPKTSSLGRYAVTRDLTDIGAFKTPTLRNIELTAPYMHDGSLKTLEEVVQFYNNGGRLKETDPLPELLSGGIRSLNLTEEQQADLVAFLKALTSPEFVQK
ncbi:MAG: cytochrome-c peroxidase [Proteobacteria bacterium]|nr:cytochrome-c peroxidase [Desulfobacterales bacterium]MBL6967070.1 cytochrome-c peroxidase [Desulfobacteraceae bacterium]MBU0988841.1 cytochrome-c peroxidase [Pseudomonadota bacterium]MBU1905297.1 cytochrome-c peroxidase [Pseudomonadota bacterium]